MLDAVNSNLQQIVEDRIQSALSGPTNTDLANAFVVGLSASGTQTMFNKLCTAPIQGSADPSINGLTPGQAFSKKVKEAILKVPPSSVSIPSICSCDPTVNMKITSVTVGTDVACNITFNNGFFHVQMGLPAVSAVASAEGWCRTEDPVFHGCVE